MWTTLEESKQYCSGDYFLSEWSTLSDDDATKLLNTAYNILVNDSNYEFPLTPSQSMRDANIIFAYELKFKPASNRVELMRQGVTSFDIGDFSESYDTQNYHKYSTYSIRVSNLIDSYRSYGNPLLQVDRPGYSQ